MAGLDIDPIIGAERRGYKQPLAMEIEINDPTKLSLLKAKFDEYYDYNSLFKTGLKSEEAGEKKLSRAEQITQQAVEHGVKRYPAIFKEVILGIVLKLAQTEGRDLVAAPILLPEVADLAGSITGLDVSRAKSVSLIDNQQGHIDLDLSSLVTKEVSVGDANQERMLIDQSTIINFAFLEAYVAIMDYARSVTQGLTSPTGIPVVEVD